MHGSAALTSRREPAQSRRWPRRALAALVAALAVSLVLPPAARASAAWTWPVEGRVITLYRNGTDPYARGQHRGIDVAARVGAPVVVAAAGSVRFAGIAGSSGLTISIRTAEGRFDTSYLHLSSISVRKGDRVGAGEQVGAVGTSGRRSASESHLHFGVREAGKRHAYRDPLAFLPPPPAPGPVRDPRGVPAPVPEPVRVTPSPAPEPAPAPAPSPHRVPVGGKAKRRVRIPAGRRAHRPDGMPGPAPRPHGVPVPAPGGHRVPVRSPSARREPEAGRRRAPHADLGRAPNGAPAPDAAPQPADGRRPDPRIGSAGLDLGWALACAGLLLAALCLGRPEETRAVAARGRAALGALLRPLTGRG